MKKEGTFVLEASWEVCNKVGGIFTVVSSKAAVMQDHYGEDYVLVGPYFPNSIKGIFEEAVAPQFFVDIFHQLEHEGIHCIYGTWLVKGSPHVILIDFSKFAEHRNEIKTQLWEWYGIDSLMTEFHDFDEPVVWSWAVARLVEELSRIKPKKVVLHCHEWLAAAALLKLRHNNTPAGLVFTTHATTLGRSIANSDRPLYELLGHINPDEEAKRIAPGVLAKHLLEKAAANSAHVFSTVSEITGIEAEHLLGKKPDTLLYNGLDMERFPTFEETTLKHRHYKTKAFDFLRFFFFPYYTFELDHTLMYFICARNEFHDKGIDVFIDALGQLNKQLPADSKRTIVAFFFIPGNVRDVKQTIAESKTYYNDLKETINDNIEEIKHTIMNTLLAKKQVTMKSLFDDNAQTEFKKKVMQVQRKSTSPPLCTHNLYDEGTNPILQGFQRVGLNNGPDDRVKVIYYPIYLSGADGLLDLNYYESMMAGHLGVFPSYYEPWGYTPQEAAALGVPSVTTDLAGFGRFIKDKKRDPEHPGVWIINRLGKSYDEVVTDLVGVFKVFSSFDQHNRVANKIAAKTLAQEASWSIFARRYFDAHETALSRVR